MNQVINANRIKVNLKISDIKPQEIIILIPNIHIKIFIIELKAIYMQNTTIRNLKK
jgi:hypothetical protein